MAWTFNKLQLNFILNVLQYVSLLSTRFWNIFLIQAAMIDIQNAVKQLDTQFCDISEILLLVGDNCCNCLMRVDRSTELYESIQNEMLVKLVGFIEKTDSQMINSSQQGNWKWKNKAVVRKTYY